MMKAKRDFKLVISPKALVLEENKSSTNDFAGPPTVEKHT